MESTSNTSPTDTNTIKPQELSDVYIRVIFSCQTTIHQHVDRADLPVHIPYEMRSVCITADPNKALSDNETFAVLASNSNNSDEGPRVVTLEDLDRNILPLTIIATMRTPFCQISQIKTSHGSVVINPWYWETSCLRKTYERYSEEWCIVGMYHPLRLDKH